ncbi:MULTISPECIES: MSMEG_0567/Sll0786 family nitrogen starvation N-acetyltransferase [unclassified Rhizobium]|uniref:MSMEG_0567/Sll0786 family nitrogen starvation N-acetyltransferase n=1 Tax=unclassified Rhizobium TaxID=2613769 RepID=UPI001AD95CF0|nr:MULTISPECIES: MSMEG_0567/Sll0786 family nitrogen starvation N-acetyltransferase [unclassified Rhizobium]MBO9123796.1 GNAT family N-acetyltransferase [Rhizobium sp. 16-488-2b]MBO9174328.1 GNAT family N-acetyltransferase [Rhizobium sp. 16-488-2a]
MSLMDHSAFISPEFIIRAASETWEVAGAFDLRRQVFVEEQHIFADSDHDEIDKTALPLVAIATLAAEPAEVVGTVRIHEPTPGIWWGSRLAVAPSYRRVGRLGAELIRLAVSTANGIGCSEFHAHVQIQNVPLFRRLHWEPAGEIDLHGVPHMHMLASLSHYPPTCDPTVGWCARARRA